MIVYLARNNVNGKGYVGQTRRTLEQRWAEHVNNALKMMCEMPIYDAIRKHGAEAFEVSVLEECSSLENLDQAEVRWISELETYSKGYNATKGGHGIHGYKHTDDAKRRMGLNRSGPKNHNYGKKGWGRTGPHTEETKRKISLIRTGKKIHTEESKKKIGLASSIHKRKAVRQCGKDGTFVKVHPSIKEAAKAVNGQANKISDVLCGRRMTHKGYIWQYDKQPERVEV